MNKHEEQCSLLSEQHLLLFVHNCQYLFLNLKFTTSFAELGIVLQY